MGYFLPELKNKIAGEVVKVLEVDSKKVVVASVEGDFESDLAIPCFAFAKELGKEPQEIAELVVGSLSLPEISKSQAISGFVNVWLKADVLASGFSNDSKSGVFGTSDEGKGKTVVVDFIGLNLAKPFSVGHLRPTVQGWALIQIYKALGYVVVGDSHMGDWGTPFGMWVAGFEKWSSDGQLKEDGAYELGRIYVKFREEAEKNETLIDEAKAWLKKLEEGDKQAKEYHERFNKISLDHANEILDKLGVKADENYGESFYVEKSQQLVDELVKDGKAEQQVDGSVIVSLEDYGLETPILLRKSDGSALYATSDLETVRFRQEKWSPSKIIYSVGGEQQFHFKQVFALADKLGYSKETDLIHAWFGTVDEVDDSGKRGKMSSRKNTALLENLLKTADKKARSLVEEELSDDDFDAISIGAIKFNDFARPRTTNILFDWDSMFSLQGHSSVYIQYAAVRVGSILKELNEIKELGDSSYDFSAEKEILMQLSKYPEVIKSAADSYEPYRIADYLYELAKIWNRYYEETSVRDSKDDVLFARTWLLGQLRHNFEHGLSLLGIQVPTKM